MAKRRLRKELLETVNGLHKAGAIDVKNVKKGREFNTFRVVQAPAPFAPPSAPLPPTFVVSVLLQPGESVEWTWTHDANGTRYVTGYTISRPRRARDARKKGHLVVTRKSGEVILKAMRTGKPTKALRALMRDGD